MSMRCIPIALAFVLVGATGIDAPVHAAEQGCGTLYDTWRDYGEPSVRQYGHGADTPHGWNTQIGFSSMSQAHATCRALKRLTIRGASSAMATRSATNSLGS